MKTPAKAAAAVKNTANTMNNSNSQVGNNNNMSGNNNNMESSFFNDKQQQQQQQQQQPQQQFASPGNGSKRPISLDLNTAKNNPAKKQRMNENVPTPMLLEQLAAPDLEKIFMPNIMQMDPVLAFSSKVTSEKEDFAKGFVEALQNLQNNDNNNAHTNGMSGGSFTYTNLDDSFPVAIKDEPQNPPGSPPSLTPIDLENQEKIKLERKRQRNRVAASKCRKRKLERISKLEDKVKILKGENADLALVVKNLKDHVFQLKQQVVEHATNGCTSLYSGALPSVMQSK